MTSLKSIASELKVSLGLVSKVLSGRMGTTRVRPELRRKILKKIEQRRYVMRRNVRRLPAGKRGAIAIFIWPWGDAGFVHQLLEGVAEALTPTAYHLWLNFLTEDPATRLQLEVGNLRSRVDGVMVGGCPHHRVNAAVRKLEAAKIPVITFFEAMKGRSVVANASIDVVAQQRIATEHLIASGCRRIVHLETMGMRARGYRQALREAGLPYNPNLVFRCADFEIEEGRRATRELLGSGIAFDAICTQSDQQAYGASLELLQRGIEIPLDVRVVGIDNSHLARLAPIPLSSVTSECREIGRLTVNLMLSKLSGEKVKSRLIQPRLIQRDSS